MKRNSLITLLFTLATVGAQAASSDYKVEVPVARIFIPARGFDDNDTVQAVVDGELPNVCYVLERQEVSLNPTKRTVTVKQFATRLTSGLCKEGSEPNTPEMKTPVPYTETVDIGKLPTGNYTILFSPATGNLKQRTFEVGTAPVPALDTLPYAMVTEVSVSDLVRLGQPVEVEIRGILNNSCYELNDDVKTYQVDDVTIVLPTVTVDRANACLMFTRPFLKKITLDPVRTEARYLVHVRSMNGKSHNRVYGVTKLPI